MIVDVIPLKNAKLSLSVKSKLLVFFVMPIVAATVVADVIQVPVRNQDARRRRNIDRVHGIVVVGQHLTDAEQRLATAGFEMLYSEPIKPTVNKDYQQQLVIVGNTVPNIFESLAYAWQFSWMPFTHSESPYVVIDADLDGTITKVR